MQAWWIWIVWRASARDLTSAEIAHLHPGHRGLDAAVRPVILRSRHVASDVELGRIRGRHTGPSRSTEAHCFPEDIVGTFVAKGRLHK